MVKYNCMNKNLIIFIILLIEVTICDAQNITVDQLCFQYNSQEEGYFALVFPKITLLLLLNRREI